ncbi:MAG: hypothetical protein PHI56_06875 [Victivallaceae bacterium]|nr:hypothetical protein [Victivallaceae bacterium]
MKTQIDVAVLGLGNMGKTHVGAAKESPYVNRIYGYEPDETFRKSRSAELDVIPESLENIIGNPAIRLVYIAFHPMRLMCRKQ